MKLTTRTRASDVAPGLRGPARVDRRPRDLVSRVRTGDVVVTDHLDLDRGTAQALVDAGVAAVVNCSPMLSGRYPALGPQVLTDAGVTVVDGVGSDALAAVPDGAVVRVHDGALHVADRPPLVGRAVDADLLAEDLDLARTGLVAQLQSFTHNSTEFLRREQDLLLHRQGVPRLGVRTRRRPAVIVADAHDHRDQLRRMRRFIAEQDPVLIGVEGGADALRAAGHQPHVVVVDSATREDDLPSLRTLRAADDVVLRVDRGSVQGAERMERLGLRPLTFEAGTTAEDAALLIADASECTVLIGVGLHATVADFLDRQRPGLASTYLTRLTVGPRLVDARALPALYSGRVRAWHLLLLMLVGLLALAAAIAVTPVGQQWLGQLPPLPSGIAETFGRLSDAVRGVLP